MAKKYKLAQMGTDPAPYITRDDQSNIPGVLSNPRTMLAFALSPQGQAAFKQWQKAGYTPQIDPTGQSATFTRKSNMYDFSPGFKDFNAIAQLITGAANSFQNYSNLKQERQYFSEANQPAISDPFSEEGLNKEPIYTEYGGKYEMKKGGKWIQGAVKHPGRCANPGDAKCPKGSPQYNLAMTFKKHHGFHKSQMGGEPCPGCMGQFEGMSYPQHLDATMEHPIFNNPSFINTLTEGKSLVDILKSLNSKDIGSDFKSREKMFGEGFRQRGQKYRGTKAQNQEIVSGLQQAILQEGGYGYQVDDEVDLTPEQISHLKKMGYDVEEVPPVEAKIGYDAQTNEFTILI